MVSVVTARYVLWIFQKYAPLLYSLDLPIKCTNVVIMDIEK